MAGTPVVVRVFDREFPAGRIPLLGAGVVVAIGGFRETRERFRDRDGCPDPDIFYFYAVGPLVPKIGDVVS